MFSIYKQYLSVAGIAIVTVSLLTGIAFGGTAGYVLANAWVAEDQQHTLVQPAAYDQSVDPEILLPPPPDLSPPAPDWPLDHLMTEEYSPVEAVNKVLPAVVTILTDGGPFGSGSGSGIFISTDGYIVTNYHVVVEADELAIVYAHGGTAEARLIGHAPQFDLAVLKIDGYVPAVAHWGDSGDVPLGTSVIAIGSALGRYQNSVTAGVLSGYNRELGGLQALLQTDAAINQGNSGGPLINLGGQVIGINTLMIRGGFARAEGLNFAVPSNVAHLVVNYLIENGEVHTPFLGVRYQELKRGALLSEVISNAPANKAGLQEGDIILTINGRIVDERHPLISLLLEHRIGDTITLELLREDIPFETTIILGERT